MVRIILICSFLLALSFPAYARHHHRHHHHHVRVTASHTQLFDMYGQQDSFFQTQKRPPTASRSQGSIVVSGRPSGCPHAFCGCGASLYLFGKIIPSLNLAWSWASFPRISMSEAGNRDAAVRRHHVVVIIANLGGGNFRVHDSNSGHHLTRIHDRRLVGYIFVRPHA